MRTSDGGASSILLGGRVTDKAGVPVANARVSVTTDAQGAYQLTPAANMGEAATVVVSATGSGRRTQPLALVTLRTSNDFVLRHADNVTSLAMPAAGEAAATRHRHARRGRRCIARFWRQPRQTPMGDSLWGESMFRRRIGTPQKRFAMRRHPCTA